MAINFPNNPTVGQIYSFGGYSWQWNGTYWESYSPESFLSTTGGTVSGDTVFLSGLTATTISASTYDNLPFSGTVNGGGTTNYIPKFTSSTGIGNSLLQDLGTQISINQGYGSTFSTALLDISSSGDTGIGARGTVYPVRGIVSGTTGSAAAIRGEANKGQYGVFGTSSGDAVGEYIGVYGNATESGGAVGGTTYIGGKFEGFNGTGAGYSVQLLDGTEGVGKVLVSQTSDGKANWASFGYGITNRAVSLTSTQVFATGTTTINAATYIDINGCSVTLAAGTWLITGHVVIAAANLIIQGFVAITTAANTVVAASALSRPASGTASLNSPLAVSWSVLVSPGVTTTYKLRAARGLTTHTSTYTVYNGTGFNTASHANDGSNLGTNILAIRIA